MSDPGKGQVDHFDLVVLGGGPGGYAAALYAASAGLKVALVECDKVGGTCLHRGCVPAKAFLETAAMWRSLGAASDFGIKAADPSIDFSVSQARKQSVVDALFKGLSGLLKGRSITVISGLGQLGADGMVEVLEGADAGMRLQGQSVILASGSTPRALPGLEVDGRLVVSSDELLDLEELPRSAAVVGGGAIGCEFASLLSDLGVKVTIVEGLETILAGCDRDVSAVVARSFKKRKIQMITGAVVSGHRPAADGATTSLSIGGHDPIEVEMIVVSVGRAPRTEDLVAPGVELAIDDRGFVVTDAWQRTSIEGVYAVGDIVQGSPQLAHVAFAESIVAVRQILGEGGNPVDYSRVPWAIYCNPEVAFAGLTEVQALAEGLEVVVKKDPFAGNSRARIIGETEGMVKVVAERNPDGSAGRILGVHMVGPWVTEQLGAGYLAVNWEATVDEVAEFIQPHPSLSETFGETVLALTGRGLHVS
jgi:dihydrolipoamide dehydrogenase